MSFSDDDDDDSAWTLADVPHDDSSPQLVPLAAASVARGTRGRAAFAIAASRDEDAVLSSKRMGNSFFLSPKEMPPAKVLPPKIPAKLNLQDGSYHRPAGRAPKGYQWDAHRGLWTCMHPGQDLNDDKEHEEENEDEDGYYSTVSDEYHTPNEEMSNTASFLSKKKMHPSNKMEDDDMLLPKIKPKINQQDGSYRRPTGRAPKGCQWDARMGLWTLEQQDKNRNGNANNPKRPKQKKETTKESPRTQVRSTAAATTASTFKDPPVDHFKRNTKKKKANEAPSIKARFATTAAAADSLADPSMNHAKRQTKKKKTKGAQSIKARSTGAAAASILKHPFKTSSSSSSPGSRKRVFCHLEAEASKSKAPRTVNSNFTDEKRLGTRVFARWTSTEYYWGYIIKVIDTGSYRLFDVSAIKVSDMSHPP